MNNNTSSLPTRVYNNLHYTDNGNGAANEISELDSIRDSLVFLSDKGKLGGELSRELFALMMTMDDLLTETMMRYDLAPIA